MSLAANLNVREFDLDDIQHCLNNAGYYTDKRDFMFAHNNDLFKYVGFSKQHKQHRFLIGFENQEEIEDTFYVSCILVALGADGTLHAEYGAMPEFEANTVEALEQYIAKVCN